MGYLLGLIGLCLILILAAFALAYLGMGAVALLDHLTLAFRWVGIQDPIAAWICPGTLIGALVGLHRTLRLTNRRNDLPKLWCGAAGVGVLVFWGSATARVPATAEVAATPPPSMAPPAPRPSLLGTWEGTVRGHQAQLIVQRQDKDIFRGSLISRLPHGTVRILVQGYLPSRPGPQTVALREVRFLARARRTGWSLGHGQGIVASDAATFSGISSDSLGRRYQWSFRRRPVTQAATRQPVRPAPERPEAEASTPSVEEPVVSGSTADLEPPTPPAPKPTLIHVADPEITKTPVQSSLDGNTGGSRISGAVRAKLALDGAAANALIEVQQIDGDFARVGVVPSDGTTPLTAYVHLTNGVWEVVAGPSAQRDPAELSKLGVPAALWE